MINVMPKTKSKRPKISVVIPSWNSEKQMKQNLPYVYKAAARVDAEIIVVDDNSQYDDSWALMQKEEKHKKHIGLL